MCRSCFRAPEDSTCQRDYLLCFDSCPRPLWQLCEWRKPKFLDPKLTNDQSRLFNTFSIWMTAGLVMPLFVNSKAMSVRFQFKSSARTLLRRFVWISLMWLDPIKMCLQCIRVAEHGTRKTLIDELLNRSRLEKLLRDSYGNYCVQVCYSPLWYLWH